MADSQNNTAMRYDEGKAPMHLLPWDALLELAHIYGRGALKYAPRNWEKGMNWSRVFDSLIRHASAWNMGEDRDKESGQLHMLHVAWNALALATYQLRGVGRDDRPTQFNRLTELEAEIAAQNLRAAEAEPGGYYVWEGGYVEPGQIIGLAEGLRFRTDRESHVVWEIVKYDGGNTFTAALVTDGEGRDWGDWNRPTQMMNLRSIVEIVEKRPARYRCLHCPEDATPGKFTCEDCDTGRDV